MVRYHQFIEQNFQLLQKRHFSFTSRIYLECFKRRPMPMQYCWWKGIFSSQYTSSVYAHWVIICHLPPFTGTRKVNFTVTVALCDHQVMDTCWNQVHKRNTVFDHGGTTTALNIYIYIYKPYISPKKASAPPNFTNHFHLVYWIAGVPHFLTYSIILI